MKAGRQRPYLASIGILVLVFQCLAIQQLAAPVRDAAPEPALPSSISPSAAPTSAAPGTAAPGKPAPTSPPPASQAQPGAAGEAGFQGLPFMQDWSNPDLITSDDDWSGAPGLRAYRGDGLSGSTGTDPQEILAGGTDTPLDVHANQADASLSDGGAAEFALDDPVVGLQGSGTADAPFLLLSLDATGFGGVQVSYNLRDIDDTADNAVQAVAVQYRLGASGSFTNLPEGFVADASGGPGLASQVSPVSVTLPARADNQPQVQIRIITANAAGSDEWIGIDDLLVTGASLAGDPNVCGAELTPIYTIQGSGAASPLDDTLVSTEGVVVGDFQASNQLEGFFIQDPAGDGLPGTSDGVFVYDPGGMNVQLGDRVRVTGIVEEFNGMTELKSIARLQVCSQGETVAPTPLDLPQDSLEAYENMLVTLPETLTASETYNLGRYGEVVLSADGRLYEPTNDQGNTEGLNNRRKLTLDDGSNAQNPATVPFLAADQTLRLGDTVSGLSGVLTYAFGEYRVHAGTAPVFERANPRPPAPPAVGGSLRVGSMNVLNYFNGDGLGGGFPTSRGAHSLEEFERQQAKVVQAILGLDAVVVGLMEIENDGDGPQSAIQDLVNALNAASTPGTYAFVTEPAPGTDEIKVAMLYQPARVTAIGAAQNYQVETDDYAPLFDRPPLAQLFEDNASGEQFALVVNHFKSKGSCPSSGPDDDQGDGQGCWNAKRAAQAAGLLDFIAGLQEADPDVLVVGDLNAYGSEDPIDVLVSGGLANLVARRVPLAQRYSYVFEGQAGYLDHALATTSLSGQVSGATIWHINADEPRVLDYNTEFNPPGLYSPDPYRSSDHDPVLVGLHLGERITYLPLVLKQPQE